MFCEGQRGGTRIAGRHHLKALIAEDEPLSRKILQELLSPEFDLTTVEDGATALALLQEEDGPALAILDWVMPGITGIDVCRELRTQPRTAGIYVILLTVRNSAADIVAGLRAGADDYVTKPVRAEDLRARVRLGCRIIELREALAGAAQALALSRASEKLLRRQVELIQERAPSREADAELTAHA
jgi:DNA-binding response OmpR family regulator